MSTSFEPEEIRAAEVQASLTGIPDTSSEQAVEGQPPVATAEKKNVAGGILQPFKVRNFNLLFGGQTISIIGDMLYAVALPWLILNNGGSAQELGIVLAAYGIPRAASTLLGGWLSDRLRPRRLMLIADIVRALLMGILAALALGGHPALWQLCAIAVPLGAFGGAFTPASMAIVPDTLNDDDLQAGNSLFFSSMQLANLVGSAIAGVVVAAFSAGAGLGIDAATFVVSALSLALMRATNHYHSPSKDAASTEKPSTGTQGQGAQISFWDFMRTSQLIQVTLLIFIMISLSTGGLIEVALPALVHGPMHGSASGYGAILASWGAGSLVGGVFAGMLGKLKHKGWIILLGGLVVAAVIALLPNWGIFGAMACMLIGGAVNSGGVTVLLFTAVQLAIPRHLMGRVMGLLMFSSSGLYPISVAVVGVLSDHFGPAILFPFSGLLLALVMLFGATQKALREL